MWYATIHSLPRPAGGANTNNHSESMFASLRSRLSAPVTSVVDLIGWLSTWNAALYDAPLEPKDYRANPILTVLFLAGMEVYLRGAIAAYQHGVTEYSFSVAENRGFTRGVVIKVAPPPSKMRHAPLFVVYTAGGQTGMQPGLAYKASGCWVGMWCSCFTFQRWGFPCVHLWALDFMQQNPERPVSEARADLNAVDLTALDNIVTPDLDNELGGLGVPFWNKVLQHHIGASVLYTAFPGNRDVQVPRALR